MSSVEGIMLFYTIGLVIAVGGAVIVYKILVQQAQQKARQKRAKD